MTTDKEVFTIAGVYKRRSLWQWLTNSPRQLAVLSVAHCEHGNRIGDFCMGCEQWRMG